MKGTPRRRMVAHFAAFGALLAGWTLVGSVRGDDLVTLSGTIYHDVRALRVDPDGVTWEYDEGVCKVDFTDSPESVRRTYHYDPAKAVAYHDAQVQQRQQADAQRQQVLQENEERRRMRLQAVASRSEARPSAGTELIFRRAASPAASEATRALGEQADIAAAKKAVEPTGVFGALAHSTTGHILSFLGVNFSQGPSTLNAGPELANRQESPSGLHQAPASDSEPDAAHNAFYTPIYSTKSYYEDVDRSDAFQRGVPLRP